MKIKKICSICVLSGLLLFTFGCGQKNTEDTSDTDTNPSGTNTNTPDTEASAPAPKSGLELTDGSVFSGTFDKSRELLQLSCREENNEKAIYINGQKQLSVAMDKTIKLYDLVAEDAYLELVVAEDSERVDLSPYKTDYLHVNVYRILPEGLSELQLFPQRPDNSFWIGDWDDLSFQNRFVQLRFDGSDTGGIYQLTPDGYLIYSSEQQTILHAGDQMVCVPERNVAVYEDGRLGIAFEPLYTFASCVHYNIYRSTDGGNTWNLIVEDFIKEVADMDYMSIPDENTVYTFWGISGVTEKKRILVSEDAGMTWHDAADIEQ